MKHIAVVLAALLSLTLVAPAMAQPFADVPTDHWAYDAIAELAAKGLIEGYPDGAFRGDRAMTRYEMAMVVARVLARIEAIKIPPMPPDLVRRAELTKTDAATRAALTATITATDKRLTASITTLNRLVAEFRAELAALGVRVTAVEEELAALRARMDNTKVTGDARFRYNVFPAGPSGPGNKHPDGRMRTRLTFTGTIAPNATAVIRLAANNQANNSGIGYDVRFGHNYAFNNVTFDMLYLDLRNTYGASLWRVGRQFYSLAPGGPYGVGLLYDPASSSAGGVTHASFSAAFPNALPLATTTTGTSDGILSRWVLGPLNIDLAIFRDQVIGVGTGTGGSQTIRDNRIVRATSSAILPGWTLGGSYFQEYVLPTAPAYASGGSGWGVDAVGTLVPGIRMYFDYASWKSNLVTTTTKAWRVGGNLDLARLIGFSTWRPTLDLEYHDYGPLDGSCTIASTAGTPFAACQPLNSYATTIMSQAYVFNMKGYLARLNLTFSPAWSGSILYEAGTTYWPSTDNAYSEWWFRLAHTLAPRTTISFNYFLAKGPTFTFVPTYYTNQEFVKFYRAELTYSW
ncbi:MAG: S-layer homology domain-containing protein [bacterium]|nr:S-layer homology domain-containing protein [bacterium]